MRKFLTKILACALLALLALSSVSAFMPVDASPISTYTLEKPTFTFTGGRSITYNCTGAYLTVKLDASASNNNRETLTIEIYVQNTGHTETHTWYSDGITYTYSNIFLGTSGGSNVRFAFKGANPAITITVNMNIKSV